MISNKLAQDFGQICQDTLGFLSTYGFSHAQLSGDPLTHSTTVRFYGKTLVIECIWDDKEDTLEVKVARLRGGKPPSEFAVDASGRRVREHLTAILVRRGVRGFGFRKVRAGAALHDRWRSQMEDYARLIRNHGDAVMHEAPDVFG